MMVIKITRSELNSEQYKDFADRVVKAYDNNDMEMLELLRLAHHNWYVNVMIEIRQLEKYM